MRIIKLENTDNESYILCIESTLSNEKIEQLIKIAIEFEKDDNENWNYDDLIARIEEYLKIDGCEILDIEIVYANLD